MVEGRVFETTFSVACWRMKPFVLKLTAFIFGCSKARVIAWKLNWKKDVHKFSHEKAVRQESFTISCTFNHEKKSILLSYYFGIIQRM